MVRITHTRGRKAPAVEQFARPCIRIGSSSANDVAFYQHGSEVMPSHAEIREEGGAYYLIDLGTPQGTYVDRNKVARHRLRSGDLVALGGPGGPEFRVDFGGAPPEADDDRVDVATAEQMVRAAVEKATRHHHKTGAIVAQKVRDAKRQAQRRNLVLGLGVALAVLGIGFAAIMIWRAEQRAAELVRSAGLGVPTSAAAQPAGAIPDRVLTGRQIYEANKAAIYVLGYTEGRKIGAFCSAFAIGADLLATNAHCVIAARQKGRVSLIATQNDSRGKVKLRIASTSFHPRYRRGSVSADSPDVGLVRVSGRVPKVVTLASDAELRAIGAGDDAFLIGFPGRVMDPISPSATFLQGHVNRVTALDGGVTTPDKAVVVQHDAVTKGGNSGSPIFNQYGHVIALHAAHIDTEEDQQVDGQKTKVLDTSPFRIAMRVDLLRGVPQP
jgi:hypothetical protein